MMKKRGLNKGRVDMLLSEVLEPKEIEAAGDQTAVTSSISNGTLLLQVPIDQLKPGKFQPRRTIQEEELKDLAESIKRQGILQPIMVRSAQGRFEIIAGERRFRAAALAGLQSVPVIVHDISDAEAMVIALVENIQRENLNPIEEAYALERLAKEFGLTHEETAKAVGKSRAAISNLLRLLHLQSDVKALLERGELDLGHAKVLLAVEGNQQVKLARIVVEKRLSVRETEKLVQQQTSLGSDAQRSDRPLDPDIARLQRSLSEKIGSPTRILHSMKGRGTVVIKYNSIDELDGILAHIV